MKNIIIPVFFLFSLLAFIPRVEAITYDLIAPTDPVQAGDVIAYTIFINSENQTLSSAEIGVNYDPNYLEYLATATGPAMNAVVSVPQETGSLIVSGSNLTGFNGFEVFADLNFTLITSDSSLGQLVSLWSAPMSPTPRTSIIPSVSKAPTRKVPTLLPRTGSSKSQIIPNTVGAILIAVTLILLLTGKKEFS